MIALLLACASQPAENPYLVALRTLDPLPCLDLPEPARGECVVATAEDLALSGKVDQAWQTCRLAEGRWAEECPFLLSDALDLVFDEADAACAMTGKHRKPCMAHAFSRELALLDEEGLDDDALVQRMEARWSAVVPPERASAEARRQVQALRGRPRSPR